MAKKKIRESVKDAFGNDIKVGDELIFFDRIFGRLSHTHLRKIVSKCRVEVVGAKIDGTENVEPPFTWDTNPFTWTVSTKRVMKKNHITAIM